MKTYILRINSLTIKINKMMKKTYIYIGIVLMLIVFGCSEDFLDKVPVDKQTEATAFKTDDNFRTYSWSFYSIFYKYYGSYSVWESAYQNERFSDNMFDRNIGISTWETGGMPTPSSDGNWGFNTVRKINLMLDNIEGSDLSDKEKNHWKAVGYFFRAYKYFNLVSRYGDVPWIEHVVSDSDEDILYGSRTPRDEVTTKMLENLQFAVENINDVPVTDNVINKDVVNAFISRFGLFEGTWRKYHGLGGEDKYLNASVAASQSLMQNHPNLHSDYDDLVNTEDLAGMAGILLYRSYVTDQVMHGSYRIERTSAQYLELTKDMVNSYLCSDGKTIEANGRRPDEPNPYIEFRNRDYRLYYLTPPPYRVTKVAMSTWDEVGLVDGVDHSEYIRLMETISKEKHKRLPVLNWTGYVTTLMPHYEQANNGQGFCKSRSGYFAWRFYNDFNYPNGIVCATDMPIFRMGEVLLNHAEAKKELGQFNQTVADATINKLRARGNVAGMVVGNIDASFDVNRDTDVDPLMWEIRRERRVELCAEGFRFDDLRRWKKGSYIVKRKVGAYIEDKGEAKPYRIKLTKVIIDGGGSTGFAQTSTVSPQSTWPDYYYLYPIPKNQIILNSNIVQNPGWESPEGTN